MEQQGTVNNRTFVLLNFRSIIVATSISIPYLSIYLSHPILSSPPPPYPTLSAPILSYPMYPTLSDPFLSCPILSYLSYLSYLSI